MITVSKFRAIYCSIFFLIRWDFTSKRKEDASEFSFMEKASHSRFLWSNGARFLCFVQKKEDSSSLSKPKKNLSTWLPNSHRYFFEKIENLSVNIVIFAHNHQKINYKTTHKLKWTFEMETTTKTILWHLCQSEPRKKTSASIKMSTSKLKHTCRMERTT